MVKGIGLFYERPLSEKPVSDFYTGSVTCYGMSISTPKLPTVADEGNLRKADFTVLKFPHPQAILDTTTNPAVGQWLSGQSFNMFAVSRGGGVAIAPVYKVGGVVPEAIPVQGDSGGPCIKHTNATDGDLVGILHAGSGAKSGGVGTPEWAHYSAASGFRKWVRCRLKQRVTPKLLPCDLDGDSQADDGVGVRRSPGGSLVLVASFNNGAQELTLDTFIPETTADVGCAFPGDFDADGDDDIVTTIGTALAGLPTYLKGSASSSFSFASVPTWQPSGPYEYFSVGNFGNACVAPADADCKNDTIDDVVAVRFDGTEDVFLGESGAGLTVPAQFVPRGFNWYGPATDEESFVISAPGSSAACLGSSCDPDVSGCKPPGDSCVNGSECCSGTCVAGSAVCDEFGFAPVEGRSYLHGASKGEGIAVTPLSFDFLKQLTSETLPHSSVDGDNFGASLAWGSFDGNFDHHALVIGAPGAVVNGVGSAGAIVYFAFQGTSEPVVRELDRSVLDGVPSAGGNFGRDLVAGDFNGDNVDDLAVVARGDLQILYGISGEGLSVSSPDDIFDLAALGLTWGLGSVTSGDFNCDGFEDLAAGAPNEDVGAAAGAGRVVILYGRTGGLSANFRQLIDEDIDGITTTPQGGGFFGQELAAGNFDGDAFAGRPCVDIAISASEPSSKGAVHVLFGSASGLTGAGSQHLVQGGSAADGIAIMDLAEPGDVFGGFTAITRADLDRFDDLVIGVYNENNAAGAAHLLRGGPSGIVGSGQALWHEGDSPIPGTPLGGSSPLAAGDRFGWAVGGTSNGLVVVGASWESLTTPAVEQAGWAAVIRTNDTSPVGIADAVGADERSYGEFNDCTDGVCGNGETPSTCPADCAVTCGNAVCDVDASLEFVFCPKDCTPARAQGFFGAAMTKPRPAFQARKQLPPRYPSSIVLTGGSPRLGGCGLDTIAPEISSVDASPSCLWPPNHKFVHYGLGDNLAVVANDNCDPHPVSRIVSVTSDENSSASDFPFGDSGVCLRSERNGSGDGRVYTIVVQAQDSAGNVSQRSVHVMVPKNHSPNCDVNSGVFLPAGSPECTFTP